MGVASLKFKVKAECIQKGAYTNSVDPDETPQNAASSSGSALFAKINTLLEIVDYKNRI